jgi:hypothetical protein
MCAAVIVGRNPHSLWERAGSAVRKLQSDEYQFRLRRIGCGTKRHRPAFRANDLERVFLRWPSLPRIVKSERHSNWYNLLSKRRCPSGQRPASNPSCTTSKFSGSRTRFMAPRTGQGVSPLGRRKCPLLSRRCKQDTILNDARRDCGSARHLRRWLQEPWRDVPSEECRTVPVRLGPYDDSWQGGLRAPSIVVTIDPMAARKSSWL